MVIAFDEFQRLNKCPGEPLSIIRTALMGAGQTGRIALVLTGSLREKLKLMLHTDTEPIWDQTHDIDLPMLNEVEFVGYVEMKFEATGRPIDEHAAERLVSLAESHPKRTQHLAWHVWQRADEAGTALIGVEDVQEAFEELVHDSKLNTDFTKIIDTLLSGDDADQNDVRALFLLASGSSVGSDLDAQRYGLLDHAATRRALVRLRDRGVVTQPRAGAWQITDPFLKAWLQEQDPLGFQAQLPAGDNT
jgi:hypothetical protein